MASPEWQLRLTKKFNKDFEKLDKKTREHVRNYIIELTTLDNPKVRGKELTANKISTSSYRVGNYRVVTEIFEDTFVIIGIEVGHRSRIYENKK